MNNSVGTTPASHHRTDRLETLSEISRVVSATLDLRTLYDTIYHQICRVMDAAHFFVALHRPGRDVLEFPYVYEMGRLMLDEEAPYENSVTTIVIEHGVQLLFHGTDEYIAYAQRNGLPELLIGEVPSQSMIFAPLNTGSRTIGALTVQSNRPHAYSEDDVQTLTVIASQAAVAIENARLFGEQQSRVVELQAIQRLAQELMPLHDIPAIAALISAELHEIIDYHACRLFSLDAGREMLAPVSTAGHALELRIGEGIAGWIALHGRPVCIPNTLEDGRVKQITGTPVRPESMIGAPLVYEGRVQGVITLSKLGVGQFDADELRLLEIVASQAATAFDRVRLYDELRREAVTDPLTRAYNRRYLLDRYREELARAVRNRRTLAVIVLDIDRFKRVNDTFGHAAGDIVLRELADAVRSVVRTEDIVARSGGEEFCVLLPETNEAGAEQAAERIRAGIEDRRLPAGAGVSHVTVSVGLALLQADEPEADLIACADAAMYEAKRRGGNRFHRFRWEGAPISTGPSGRGSAGTAELGLQALDPSSFYDLLDAAGVLTVTSDLEGRVQYVNGCLSHMTGWNIADVLGHDVSLLGLYRPGGAGRGCCTDGIESGAGTVTIETPLCTPEGGERLVQWTCAAMRDLDGRPCGLLALGRDVTEQRQAHEDLQRQSLYDALTGLPNRELLYDRVAQVLRAADRDGEDVALLLMDLDRFKDLNDSLGHQTGDQLLVEVAERIRKLVRGSDTVARLGGDEFALALSGASRGYATAIARKMLNALQRPLVLAGQSLHVDASIGIALYPGHGSDADTLLRQADVAMYVAKRAGAGYAVYSAEHDRHSRGRLALTAQLRRAIESDQLVLYYQPKVRLSTGAVGQVEALVRWMHPERGLIPPNDFVPLAEETGLIKGLTRWVLNRAVQQSVRWREAGLPIRVAVNLSARSIHDPQLPGYIARLLRGAGMEGGTLDVEITESAIVDDPDRAMDMLLRLHGLGIRVAIDDFGTGYSSLGYLKRLPVDEVKIDKSFVLDMTRDEDSAIIVRSVIDLGHNLGLEVVAEGVEDATTYAALRSSGCDLLQGNHLSRPVPPDALEVLLRTAAPLGVPHPYS